MGDTKKMLMLTNKSERTFTTSKGQFFPGTSKEFDEKEAVGLLSYVNEILRSEDALGNPKIKNQMVGLRQEVAAKAKEIKRLMENALKGIDPKATDDLKAKSARIEDLENSLEKLVKLSKERDAKIVELEEAVKKHIADKKSICEEKDKEITGLKKDLKEAKKK